MRNVFQTLEAFEAGFSRHWNLFCAVLLLAGAAGCATRPTVTEGPFRAEVSGSNFVWSVRYAGADGRLGTADDVCGERELLLPEHARVELSLRSGDFIYLFSIPALGLREVAVPGLEFTLAFETGEASVFDFKGDELCGLPHAPMRGRLLVESVQEVGIQLDGMSRCDGSK